MESENKDILSPHKEADKAWYLSLLDNDEQQECEKAHLVAVLGMLRRLYISRHRKKIKELQQTIEALKKKEDYSAADFRETLNLNAEIAQVENKLNTYKCFFTEPYFARMDVVDEQEGYNAYYIGKKGDINLEIVDWRAPLAVRYYQKSRVNFKINDYNYRTVLRRALSVKNGKLIGFQNEYLSVREALTQEEIGGRDEEILFDPYLRSILKERKEDYHIRDIIRTIQEQQFEIVNRPERESFVLQGCAGSGKTMILLHRLSYLMYNNERLSPHDVLVITPSNTFNAYIDELAQVLELQKVKTTTLRDYYFRALKGEGIELSSKLGNERENEDYVAYLYSEEFPRFAESEIYKLYGDVSGLFTSEECRAVAEQILEDCNARQNSFVKVKNASVRIRRCVLGEMKERADGGFYFTKPFRALMSAFVQVEDFLKYVLRENQRTPDYFFRQFAQFYRCGREIYANAERVFAQAQEDLARFSEIVEKEILDLLRFRRRKGEEEVLTYQERIERRRELKAETLGIARTVSEMEEGVALFCEFFEAVKSSAVCTEAGKCESPSDILRWIYRKTVKKIKQKYDMKGVYPSDGYALCVLLTAAGRALAPRFGLVFVDEGQDLSPSEYALLKKMNPDAAFNVFGDLKQNITPQRGMKEWDESFGERYVLHRNYRNTNEIVEYVSKISDVEMSPVGMHGEEVKKVKLRGVSGFFRDKQGLKAVIAKEEYFPLFKKRGYNLISETGKLAKNKINVMTVYESKGLEFTAVAVYDEGMSVNEKYIAFTRALQDLAVVESENFTAFSS